MSKKNRKTNARYYLKKFPPEGVDRFTIPCPDCKQGCNSADYGGNEVCFHCDNCGLEECEATFEGLGE